MSTSPSDEVASNVKTESYTTLDGAKSANGVGKAVLPRAQQIQLLEKELEDVKAQEKGLPHRWLVVIAMVAAFVLCNMDKVRPSTRSVANFSPCLYI
jgi:hypothetical protein